MRGFRALPACVLAAATAAAAGAPPPAPPLPPPGMTPCECVKDARRCWPLAKQAFAIHVSLKKTEVEGALPGRFVAGAQAWALREPDKDGHFLRVECGAKVPCASVRDLLEKRLAESALVQSVSREPEKKLFSPKTWELTAKGKTVVEDAKRCRPGLWTELAPALTSGSLFE